MVSTTKAWPETDLGVVFPLQDGGHEMLTRVLLHVVPPPPPVQPLPHHSPRAPGHGGTDQVDGLRPSPRDGQHRDVTDGAAVRVLAAALGEEDRVGTDHLAPTDRLLPAVQLQDPGHGRDGHHLGLQLVQHNKVRRKGTQLGHIFTSRAKLSLWQ